MKMALSVPLADVMAYRKLGKAFFGLLEVLCAAHTHVIAACDTPTFAFLITALDSGLKSLDVVVSSQCAAAVDNLAGFYFKALQATAPGEAPSPTAQVGGFGMPGHATHTNLPGGCPISEMRGSRNPDVRRIAQSACTKVASLIPLHHQMSPCMSRWQVLNVWSALIMLV